MRKPLITPTLAIVLMLLYVSQSFAETLSIKEVANGIFVHQGIHELPDPNNKDEIANIGFIVGDSCVAVIDSGGSPEQGEALKNTITATTKTPICFVINTHVHPDHIYGNIAFKQPNVKFLGHKRLGASMSARAPYYIEAAKRDIGLMLTPDNFVPPDIAVETTKELDLGGRTLVIQAHPTAHTDNDLSIYDTKTKTIWLSDLLFMGHIPVVDGSLNGWIDEIQKLRSIDALLAIPGHGPVSANWPLCLLGEEAYLRMLQTEIRAAIKSKQTIEKAIQTVGLSAREEWKLFDQLHKKNITTSFAELEWED